MIARANGSSHDRWKQEASNKQQPGSQCAKHLSIAIKISIAIHKDLVAAVVITS
jgi:hypothetical protein